jgi:hypothetical protein
LEDIDDEKARKISREQLIRKHVKGLLGAALRHMGLKRFLEILPLKSPSVTSTPGVSDDRLWVLHIIRHNLRYTRCSLSHFVDDILGAARECETAARAAEQAGMLKAAKVPMLDILVVVVLCVLVMGVGGLIVFGRFVAVDRCCCGPSFRRSVWLPRIFLPASMRNLASC